MLYFKPAHLHGEIKHVGRFEVELSVYDPFYYHSSNCLNVLL